MNTRQEHIRSEQTTTRGRRTTGATAGARHLAGARPGIPRATQRGAWCGLVSVFGDGCTAAQYRIGHVQLARRVPPAAAPAHKPAVAPT